MANRPDDYRRVVVWQPGETTTKPFLVGGLGAFAASEGMPSLGLLRVGYFGARLGPACGAWVVPADGGTQIGDETSPLDVPLLLIAEQPMALWIRPLSAPTVEIALRVAVTPVIAMTDRGLYATRTVILAAGAVLALPQWVRGVSVFSPGTFTFLDRAGADITAVGISGAHDRPTMAASLRAETPGTFVLYY